MKSLFWPFSGTFQKQKVLSNFKTRMVDIKLEQKEWWELDCRRRLNKSSVRILLKVCDLLWSSLNKGDRPTGLTNEGIENFCKVVGRLSCLRFLNLDFMRFIFYYQDVIDLILLDKVPRSSQQSCGKLGWLFEETDDVGVFRG